MNIEFLLRPIALRRDLHRQLHRMFLEHMPKDAVVYDIGCGQKPFADFLRGKVKAHIGVDLADGFYAPDQVDLIGTAYSVPAPDGSGDAIILSQVIEHLETPLLAMEEASRLLKPGGILFLSFPFLYPQHAQPRDYLRYTEYYLANKLADKNFEIIACDRIGGFWYLTGMYMTIYLQQFDRGILKMAYLTKIASLVIGLVFLVLHKAEGAALRLIKRDASNLRSKWTVNYVTVLRKKG